MAYKLKLPERGVAACQLLAFLTMLIMFYLIDPKGWIVYTVLLPALLIEKFLTECGMNWKVSKKAFTLKNAIFVSYIIAATSIGSYLS